MKPVVLYHANCSDGFGAAWSAWKRFGEAGTYLPVDYGTRPPQLDPESQVYILDFSFPREVIEKMQALYAKLIVIEHHQTAAEELEGLQCLIFDSAKSAAVLSWEYFHPGTTVPELLQYVMDRDLWRFRLTESREVFAALNSYPMDFLVWDRLEASKLAVEGEPILRYQREVARTVCDQARLVTIAGYRVPVVNTATLVSEVGEELLKRFPESPFAASYFDRLDGQRQWSLRSREDFDVSEIAKSFGNGGHARAAGFETPLSEEDYVPKPRFLPKTAFDPTPEP
ncbi:MAG TPA: phosphoesterase [Vicinamibacteria bacterium]|nr:phosphoesterase [Vicinamibacteria bacterium]